MTQARRCGVPVIYLSIVLLCIMGLFPSAASSQPVDSVTGYTGGLVSSAELSSAPLVPNAPRATAAAPLGQYGFESGTTEGWFPRGQDVTLAASTEAARSGNYSLKVTGRTASWNSPGLNVLGRIQPNGTYEIEGCMRLVAGQAVTQTRGIISMERTLLDGSKRWDWVAPSAPNGVTAAGWTCLKANYSFDTPVQALVLYAETQGDTAAFYLDDVSIRLVTPPPSGTVVEYNFEDGTTQGWAPRGPVTLAALTEAAHTGNYSLKTTGRTDPVSYTHL
ncbi:MAG: carbohydrate binding domain-containing protein, partial [Anaerolineae bacterium]|nr:carbohydrate binding domain-containing protein [Anaerolineae bacterium]